MTKHLPLAAATVSIALVVSISSAFGQPICVPDCVDGPEMFKHRKTEESIDHLVQVISPLDVDKWSVMPGGAWKPGQKVKDRLSFTLAPVVEGYARLERRKLREWSAYTFQIQGRRDKRKVVFVNAFCTSPPADAKRESAPTDVSEACSFSLIYDPDAHTYSQVVFGD